MDDRLREKMMGQSLRQYGRNVAIDPLSPSEKEALKLALENKRYEEPDEDLYAHIEDVVYEYITNQGRFS